MQAMFEFPRWGGARKGAGRKPKGERAEVPHQPRKVKAREPQLVTSRLVRGLPSLRSWKTLGQLRLALKGGSEKEGFRLVYSS